MSMTVDQIVRVSFADRPRAIHLPPDLIWYLPGTQSIYVKLIKYRSEICRLLGQPLVGKGKGRKLQHTSIIEDLIKLRDNKITTIVEELEKKDEKIDLEIDIPKKKNIGWSMTEGRSQGGLNHQKYWRTSLWSSTSMLQPWAMSRLGSSMCGSPNNLACH